MTKMETEMETETLNQFMREIPEYPDWCEMEKIDLFSVNAYGDTILHLATCQNRLDILKTLLKNDFPLNKKGEHGYTALHEAIEQQNYLAALYLIKMGADLLVKNDAGKTPLDLLEI